MRGIFSYFRKLPRDKALKRGELVGKFLWAIHYRRKVVYQNLDFAFPDKPFSWKKDIAKKSIIHIGRIIAEFPKLQDYVKNDQMKDIFVITKGKKLVEKYKDDGIVMITAHLGNWEMFGAGLSYTFKSFKDVYALAYRQENEAVNKLIYQLRTGYGIHIIHHNDPLKNFLNALNKKSIVIFLADQNTIRTRGVFVDFFGIKAITVTFPAKLSIRYKKPILFGYCHFNYEDKKYYCEIEEIEYEEGSNRDETVYNLTEAYTKKIENAVKKHPDQYLWVHKRWRTRPEGEPSLYND